LEKRREIELYSSQVKRKTEVQKQELLYSNEKCKAEVQQVTMFEFARTILQGTVVTVRAVTFDIKIFYVLTIERIISMIFMDLKRNQ
jgi:hypothetical protein